MFLGIPYSEDGVVLDPYLDANLSGALNGESVTDIFIYSHGWWTSTAEAMVCYNRFAVGLAAAMAVDGPLPNGLALAIHWPSMLSENEHDWLNCFEAASFFTMEKRADHVGQRGVAPMLGEILERTRNTEARFHLIGHSFGCKVLCAALEEIVTTCDPAMHAGIDFNLMLLQAAFEDDALATGGRYGRIASQLPGLRVLITKSSQDTALSEQFPRAHRLELLDHEDRSALGAVGPTPQTISAFGGAVQFTLAGPGCASGAPDFVKSRLWVADLSAIHRERAANGAFRPAELAGQHSDIYFAEIYGLLALFLSRRADSNPASL
ncbi:MAG TPA: alpha/beta hydrolase [Tepidisphaeraceae bacterium]|nr:alpha/beta hydrolase [Tepidisphaeraceae bacterium]